MPPFGLSFELTFKGPSREQALPPTTPSRCTRLVSGLYPQLAGRLFVVDGKWVRQGVTIEGVAGSDRTAFASQSGTDCLSVGDTRQ